MKFRIEQTEFEVPEDHGNVSEFLIKSSPKPYSVYWDNAENPCEKINEKLAHNANNILLIDEKVYGLYRDRLQHHSGQVIFVSALETSKTLAGAEAVFNVLYEKNFSKSDELVVVGGGITQDIGAFIGATYKRGIKWSFFPTTLLAMSDSCIGGKSGLNFKDAKNQLALFSAPTEIIINTKFIETLDQRDIKSGLGEILKLFITGGKEFIEKYKQLVRNGEVEHHQNYHALIQGALAVKKAVIEKDEFEYHERKALNYGHTFGHVLESMSNYEIPHGIAVVLGIMLINQIACNMGQISAFNNAYIHDICHQLLNKESLSYLKKLDIYEILSFLKQDKKFTNNRLTFVILTDLGNMKFMPLEIDNHLAIQIEEATLTMLNKGCL
jgi:3-dehydroquinate synthase